MLVSIIIPVFNAEAFLARAVNSAIRAGSQVSGQWEILLVDNKSQDTSREIMETYRLGYPQWVRTLTAHKQGAPSARNVGLAAARGHWIQFLDADDYLAPDKISAQLALTTLQTDWVIGAYQNEFADGTRSDSVPHPDPWQGLVDDLRIGNTNSNLYRRRALTRAGNWNEETAAYDDPNLHFRLLCTDATFVIDPVVRSYYCHHTGVRVTSTNHAEQNRQALCLLAEVNTYLSASNPTYWSHHKPLFLGALLRRIRILATYDLSTAAIAYRRYFDWSSPWSTHRPYRLVPRYTRLYPYLGFRTLESVRLFLTRYLPPTLKQLLKS